MPDQIMPRLTANFVLHNRTCRHPLSLWRVSIYFVVALCVVPQLVDGADARLAGTWQISAPKAYFKPEGGEIPFTTEGQRRYVENKRYQAMGEYAEYDHTMARCSSPGMPRLMLTPMRFRIYLERGYIEMAFEWNRLVRQIALPDLPQQQEAPISAAEGGGGLPSSRGLSKGHWEGKVLMVGTDNISDGTLIDALVPHGDGLKITEYLRLRNAETLEDHIRIEDAEHFARPWETVVSYRRKSDSILPEAVCLDRLAAGQPPLPR
jgi:hypothetical protein